MLQAFMNSLFTLQLLFVLVFAWLTVVSGYAALKARSSQNKNGARHIEVVCNGLNLWHRTQRAVVSPVTRELPQTGAATHPGSALHALRNAARRKRRQTYPELDRSRRCRLVVFGLEVGGRWDSEAATFVRLLVRARAARAPAALRASVQAAWVLRWSGIISVAAYLPRAPRPV